MKTTTSGGAVGSTVHAFELAGLGSAPFRFVGVEVKLHQVPGELPRAGSSCDFCGASIANCCWIVAADGRRFKVGSDCVQKTGDAGLRRVVDRAVRAQQTAKREAREDAKIAEGVALLDAARASLASKPHPDSWRASQGGTLLSWIEWMLANAGRSGKLRAVKAIAAAAVQS